MSKHNWKSICTWDDVCRYHGIDKKVKGDLTPIPCGFRKFTVATARLALIVKAINGDWVPDWDNGSQRKWWGWFWMNKPGFRFHDSYCDCADTRATGGSRLCCETEEQFMHLVKHFLSDLEAFYTA